MRLILFLSLLAGPLCLTAQTFEGGIMAGFTAAQVDGDNFAGYNKSGFQAGVFTATSFSSKVGARFEVKYAGRGAHQKYKEGSRYYKLSLHYIDLPLTLNYMVWDKLKLEAGISAGYLFKLYEEGSGEYEGSVIEFTDKSQYNNFDLGGIIGMDYPVFKHFTLNFRFYYSVLPIRKDVTKNPEFYQGGGGFNNNVLSFGVYYTL